MIFNTSIPTKEVSYEEELIEFNRVETEGLGQVAAITAGVLILANGITQTVNKYKNKRDIGKAKESELYNEMKSAIDDIYLPNKDKLQKLGITFNKKLVHEGTYNNVLTVLHNVGNVNVSNICMLKGDMLSEYTKFLSDTYNGEDTFTITKSTVEYMRKNLKQFYGTMDKYLKSIKTIGPSKVKSISTKYDVDAEETVYEYTVDRDVIIKFTIYRYHTICSYIEDTSVTDYTRESPLRQGNQFEYLTDDKMHFYTEIVYTGAK